MENELSTIEESFESIPPEVQKYIYSAGFREKLGALFLTLTPTTPESHSLFTGALYGYLSQNSTEEEFDADITALATTPQDKEKILAWVSEHVIEKILSLITDAYIDASMTEEEESSTSTPLTETPSTKDVLANLGARLSQSSVIVPSKREYTVYKPVPTEPSVQNITPSMDPYRELPEK